MLFERHVAQFAVLTAMALAQPSFPIRADPVKDLARLANDASLVALVSLHGSVRSLVVTTAHNVCALQRRQCRAIVALSRDRRC